LSKSAWGDKDTEYFFSLTPDKILNAIEKSLGVYCTGRIMGLNSMENRVYEIEIELDEKPRNPSDNFVIAKFYRPGRWSIDQLNDEHTFLSDLKSNDIPAIAPRPFLDNQTIHRMADAEIYYTVFPKQGGRSPDELPEDDIGQIGRLLARMHNIGKLKPATHRIKLTPQTYGLDNLRFLVDSKIIPQELVPLYREQVEAICTMTESWFAAAEYHRIHGDCHLGNLLHRDTHYYWVDFDDMLMGPAVQDLWLLLAGRGEEAGGQLDALVSNYEIMKAFDRSTLRLIEPLRALRYVHFSAWIGKRWQDPAFPKAFPHFGTDKYWREQVQDLIEQRQLIASQTAPIYM
jgi:Ser/Thr protein kinase RdoA (MazF antagonist)